MQKLQRHIGFKDHWIADFLYGKLSFKRDFTMDQNCQREDLDRFRWRRPNSKGHYFWNGTDYLKHKYVVFSLNLFLYDSKASVFSTKPDALSLTHHKKLSAAFFMEFGISTDVRSHQETDFIQTLHGRRFAYERGSFGA